MIGKSLAVAVLFLILVSGCVEPAKDEVLAVKSIELPSGWQVSVYSGSESDWNAERTAYLVKFSNPDKLCKEAIMGGFGTAESAPSIFVVFYKKEFAEQVEDELGSALMFGETANTLTENYFVTFSNSWTNCHQDQDEKELLQRICLALVPFTESKDPNWSGYCEP